MRVLFTTAPLHGHFFPLVPLAWACRSLGHEVLVATSDHFVATALQAGLPAVPSGPGIVLRELADPGSRHGIEDARYAHGRVFARIAARNLDTALALADAWEPDIVVSERAELTGPIVAVARGVPLAELQWGTAQLMEYRTAAEVVLRPRLRRLGLDALPNPDAIFNPWPPSLRAPYAAHQLGLRHVPYDGEARMRDWMLTAGATPRICFTMGTVLPHLATGDLTGLVQRIVQALATLDCELVIAVDEERAKDLGPLPPVVRHAGRVPLSRLLSTCSLLVHHGGQGSSLTALAAGCPQVVLPLFDDQLENADAVVASGSGLAVPLGRATAEQVVQHCRDVLADPVYAHCAAAVAAEIAAQPSPVEAAALLERLALRRDPPGESNQQAVA